MVEEVDVSVLLWVQKLGSSGLIDIGLKLLSDGVMKAVFQSALHWLGWREALIIETKGVASSWANSWQILMNKSTRVVARLVINLNNELATSYS